VVSLAAHLTHIDHAHVLGLDVLAQVGGLVIGLVAPVAGVRLQGQVHICVSEQLLAVRKYSVAN
jgi:hypothetical protein